jgi:lysophospholipase L1-like esterase
MARGWRTLAVTGAATLVAGSGAGGAGWAGYHYLVIQGRRARGAIGRTVAMPPSADGIYHPDGGYTATGLGNRAVADLHMMVFGDSTAAGLGAKTAAEVPGVRLAAGLAAATGMRIRLSTKAIPGATSKGLPAQVDAMFIAGAMPDVSVIIIGANDVTAQHSIRMSAHRLGEVAARLHKAGSAVIVGTCPDFGVISAIPQPLRTIIREWGLRLARAQAAATSAAGGTPVALSLLAPEFLAAPKALLSEDGFHPSAEGYALAAAQLLPAVVASAVPLAAHPSGTEASQL